MGNCRYTPSTIQRLPQGCYNQHPLIFLPVPFIISLSLSLALPHLVLNPV
jgi:hypothetical protein